MRIICGLGNPDKQYENTFHNLGFMSVDKAAELCGASFTKNKHRALIAEAKMGAEKVIFVKPQTYMNLSGESLREIVSFYKANLSDLIVIYDDYDLASGSLRIRESGSAGTHNGMRNIVKELGSGLFPRIRVGFKPKTPFMGSLVDFVLSGIKGEDKQLFDDMTMLAAQAAVDFAKGVKIDAVMQKYNKTV